MKWAHLRSSHCLLQQRLNPAYHQNQRSLRDPNPSNPTSGEKIEECGTAELDGRGERGCKGYTYAITSYDSQVNGILQQFFKNMEAKFQRSEAHPIQLGGSDDYVNRTNNIQRKSLQKPRQPDLIEVFSNLWCKWRQNAMPDTTHTIIMMSEHNVTVKRPAKESERVKAKKQWLQCSRQDIATAADGALNRNKMQRQTKEPRLPQFHHLLYKGPTALTWLPGNSTFYRNALSMLICIAATLCKSR